MGSGQRLKSLVVFSLVLCMLMGPLSVHADGVQVMVDPELSIISGQDAIEVALVIQDVTNLFGLDIRLRFNADMVQVEDGNPSKAGIQVLPGEFPVADFEVKNVVDNEAGTIWYAVTQLNPREPVSGSGRVFTVRLVGRTPGFSALEITALNLVDSRGASLDATTRDGGIEVEEGGVPPLPSDPTATPSLTLTPLPTYTPTATAMLAATSTAQPTSGLPAYPGATATSQPTVTPRPTLTAQVTPTPTSIGAPPLPTAPGAYPEPTKPEPIATHDATAMPTPLATPSSEAYPGGGPTSTPAQEVVKEPTAIPTILQTPTSVIYPDPTTMVAQATLAPTSGSLPPARSIPQSAVQKPLLPKGLFIFLSVALLAFSVLLFVHLLRKDKRER